LFPFGSFSQQVEDSSGSSAEVGADIVSRYVWRGLSLSPGPNIQPYLDFTYKGFAVGAWSSYGISDQYAEVDFYLSCNIEALTVSITDYYTEDELNLSRFDHFNWKNKSTNHALEASLDYSLPGKIPLSIKAATLFYGNDRNQEGNLFYSTYIELSYPFQLKDNHFNIAIGTTPSEGLYASEASIVHVGLSATKNIRVSEQFSVPLSVNIVSNPKREDIFVWLAMSF